MPCEHNYGLVLVLTCLQRGSNRVMSQFHNQVFITILHKMRYKHVIVHVATIMFLKCTIERYKL